MIIEAQDQFWKENPNLRDQHRYLIGEAVKNRIVAQARKRNASKAALELAAETGDSFVTEVVLNKQLDISFKLVNVYVEAFILARLALIEIEFERKSQLPWYESLVRSIWHFRRIKSYKEFQKAMEVFREKDNGVN